MRNVNRYLEAFRESYNAVGMASVVAISLATLNPLPLIAGLVAEAAYLLIVPDTKWFEARLARKFDAEIEARRRQVKEQTLPLLRPEMQERFLRLEQTRKQIEVQSHDDKEWFRQVLRKLDYVLEKFLLFAGKEVQFRNYLQNLRGEVRGERQRERTADFELDRQEGNFQRKDRNDRKDRRAGRNMELNDNAWFDPHDLWVQKAVEEVQAHYAQECESVLRLLEKEADEDTRAVLEKRTDVLKRRQEFAGRMGKILTNINHQLQLVEDTFGLINDEIRARSPEQILTDIEEVVVATNTMATALEDLAPLEQMIARVMQ